MGELALSLTNQIKARGKGPVAITSFVNTRGGSYCPSFNSYLVDRLNILLVKSNTQFDVVTRDRVEEIFKETNLALGKNYDASTFAKIGHMLGARALIRGSYTVLQQGATISIAAQLLDVESGRIVGGEVAELPLSADVRTLLEGEACEDRSSSPVRAPVSGTDQARPDTASPQRFETKRAGSLELTLRGCKVDPEGLLCEALVTNLGDERQYCLVSRADTTMMSRIVDDRGNVRNPSKISLAENSGNMIIWECANLPSRVPVRATLLFRADGNSRLPEEGSRLKLLEFGFDILNYGSRSPTSFFVQFRDVAVTR
ncbi:MAG TPA: CsgG/HfaB family protein [Candidatus Angelobacter sp.]|nr:CsgG/HfaB family protein [Candidatus Angelobacter sp.]